MKKILTLCAAGLLLTFSTPSFAITEKEGDACLSYSENVPFMIYRTKNNPTVIIAIPLNQKVIEKYVYPLKLSFSNGVVMSYNFMGSKLNSTNNTLMADVTPALVNNMLQSQIMTIIDGNTIVKNVDTRSTKIVIEELIDCLKK